MKLNPQEAPLYGECVLTVQLDDDDDVHCAEGEEEEVEFYLLFSGSTQRHLTSTVRIINTLQAVCPAHNVCEQVSVTLCLARTGGPVETLSQETFCFVQDLALDMVHSLLDNSAPQEVLLLDEEQDCERLDHSLALALKHLTQSHRRTSGPGTTSNPQTQMDVEGQTAVPQCQQLSSLLHWAASHGLMTVASFLLQQPGGKEALRRPNSQGLSPACLAESRGHQQLVELFTQYEASLNAQVEPKQHLHFCRDGRVFQHHAGLDTYTLTSPGLQRDGEEPQSNEESYLQEEVKDLRRLIHLHKDKKGNTDFEGTISLTHALSSLCVDRELASSACRLQACSNGQEDNMQDVGLAAVTTENHSTTTEVQGSVSLEERAQGEDSAVVTHTSCASGSLCQRKEAGGEKNSTPAANSPAGRNRKGKKRTTKTTKHVTESPANNRSTLVADRGITQRPSETTGSGGEICRTLLPRESSVSAVFDDIKPTQKECSPRTDETPSTGKSEVFAPGLEERCTGRKPVALPTTTITEKQEGEKWEVDLLICARVVETETVTEAEQRDNESLPANEPSLHIALGSTAETTVAMGQEQSQDPQESQSDPEESSQPDALNKSPQSGRSSFPKSLDTERKAQRGLRLDGGWIGSKVGSPSHAPEAVAKTVWYQGENLDQSVSEHWNSKEVNSKTIWYDSETVVQEKHKELEQGMKDQKECDLSSPQASGLSSPQLSEQGFSSHQLSGALSQAHAAGTKPALSHGPGAQRREVHGSQRGEEVGPEWKEGGVEGDREEVSNRKTPYSQKSSETAETEGGEEEKQESEEKRTKGRKKRRKKRGKRGGTEAKLSSSSSIESHSQIDIDTQEQQVTNLNTQPETESEAKDKTGRADVQSPSASEPTQREDTAKDAMHLPSQTEGQTRDTHGPDCTVTNLDPNYTTPDFSPSNDRTDLTQVTASQTLETKELSEDVSTNLCGPDDFKPHSAVAPMEFRKMDNRKDETEERTTVDPMGSEVLDPTKPELIGFTGFLQQTVDNVDSKALLENEDLTVAGKAEGSMDQTCLVESICSEELPVKHSDHEDFTEDLFLVEFPEHNTQPVQSLNKPIQPMDCVGRSVRFTEARSLLFEGTADVSPLQKGEGRDETTQREYSEHCLASEMLRDRQHKEEKRNELWVGEEEVVEERSLEKRTKNDQGMVDGNELLSVHSEKMTGNDDFPCLEREKEQDYNEYLVATAVAVVTVAIASAMAHIELSQQLADIQSDSQESPSQEPANVAPATLVQDTSVPTNTLNQPVDNLLNTVQSTQLSAQLMNEDKESCQLLATPPNEKQNQRIEHLHSEPTKQFTSEEQGNVEISELQCNTETEKLPVAQLSSKQNTNLGLSTDIPSLPQPDKEGTQTETTQNKLLRAGSLPEEECSPLQVDLKDLSEANEMITTNLESEGHIETETQLQEEGQLPVIDTGQHPETFDTVCPDSKENPKVGEQKDPPNSHDRDDSQPEESISTEGEEGKQVHESSKAEESVRCEKHFPDKSDSYYQAKEQTNNPQLDCMVETPCDGGIATLPFSCGSTPPVAPCDLTHKADLSPEEPAAPVIVETSKYQSAQLVANPTITIDGDSDMFQCKGLDTVDGWKESQRNMTDIEEEAKKEMVTVEDTSQTEAEICLTAKDQDQPPRRDVDSTHTLEIHRERDDFYPVQPCPEPNAVTTCTDVHPEGEECVPVCLSNRDKDSLKASAELYDSVFKKPEVPPPCVGHKDTEAGVPLSSTDDTLTKGAPSPNVQDLSVNTCDAVAPESLQLCLKSELKDKGDGGEEEEKKDQLPENPVSSAILRASIHSSSPFRRHSWEPGRNNAAADSDIIQYSSFKNMSDKAKRAKPPLHRRSMSWCPSNLHRSDHDQIENRSYSLEGLEVERGTVQAQCPSLSDQKERTARRSLRQESQERGSLVSLTEEEQEGDLGSPHSQASHQILSVTTSCPAMFHHQTLTKSISMVAISHRDVDVSGFPRTKRQISLSLSISPLLPKNRRLFSVGSFSSDDEEGGRVSSVSTNSGTMEYSISEEEPGPLRNDTEGKGGPKISRTFSYLRNKMSKKGKEKEKKGEKERESKEREKKNASTHLFIPVSPPPSSACQHCNKVLHNKETFLCSNCGVHVHKCCRDSLSVCTKSKTKQQLLVPEAVPGSANNMRSKSTSSASSVSSTSSSSSRERWSTTTTPDDQLPVVFPRRHPSIFNPHSNLAKSISTSNIAGLDDIPLKGLKFLSQSTDSLHQSSKVNASTESLTDEGTEMMDSQLMGEFEWDVKDLEADSWSSTVDKKFLKVLKKDEIKRQDVIYELYQTEFHHVRTLKIMSEVYYKGIQKELQLDSHTLDKIFPVLDNLMDTHTHFLTLLLERKRSSSAEGQNNNNFLIRSIGDILVNQFSGNSAERMKKVYGKFCSHHNKAVNLYKDLYAKDKRFQAFIKRIMSSSIVRRLSIPECILLVTQRITKYPVLIQRILQHTKDSDEDYGCVSEALRCVKELIMAVDSKVNEQEKKQRLREVYSRTDSKSIMRMKSGQMFAKEDLIRGRKLLHDGALQLKNSAGRLKDVHAMLLSDVLVFLQEKDQKYVFASLDQRSTVISLQNLIVREVANAERGLFLISAGTDKPEMVEVLASSKEERNTWRTIIQDAMHCMEKDEDEGVPSETEEDRRQQENRAKEIRELLQKKDEQIISLLEEKIHIFKDLGGYTSTPDDKNSQVRGRMLFRATPDDVTKGEPIIKDALREVETLHTFVTSGVGGAGCSTPVGLTGGSVGPVCLPRRAETFGGFDSHQMNSSKNGEKEEGDESLDLRRTESDSVLKKGVTASLHMLLRRNNEVQHSVTRLHDLLISLQAIVVQQDSFIEDQRQALSDRLTANSSRHSSSSSLSSSSSSRPSSLIEQEKHRSLERQRQEAASLQKQQAAHHEEKRRREKVWELKEKGLAEREERVKVEEEEVRRRSQELTEERDTLQKKKEEYQRELERLREAQRRLERDKEVLRRDTERLEAMKKDESQEPQRYQRTPSTTSEESIRFNSSGSLDQDSKEAAELPKEQVELSTSAPTKESFLRIGSKRMSKNFNPFSSSASKSQGAEKESQLPTRLLQLGKPKEKKDKKKKKGKGGEQTPTESKAMSNPPNDGDIFFC